MNRTRQTLALLASLLAFTLAAAGCVELSRTEKMTTFSGTGKGGRAIPGYEGQKMPEK